MPMKTEELAEKNLAAENEDYMRLRVQHQRYEQQLADFDRLPHLLPDQELERRTIQKLTLAGKDRMAAIEREAAGR